MMQPEESGILVSKETRAAGVAGKGTHREACPGAQVFSSHQQGIECGSSTAHSRLGVLHSQYQCRSGDLLPLLPHLQLCGQNLYWDLLHGILLP